MKKLPKKLKLAKETLRNLEANSLEGVFGGATDVTVCDVTGCLTTCVTNCRFTACMSNCTACLSNCPACA